VSSIAGFERVLLATKQYAVVQAGQKRDPGPEPPGIWRMSVKNNDASLIEPVAVAG
jgi:hypothetical protein